MASPAPDVALAARVLPPPLYRALVHVFAQGIEGCMLVGGTALSGYYAGHRRSDDLDLFTRDASVQRAAVLAVGSLGALGTRLATELATAQFHSSSCLLEGHAFTVQVVLDANLFAVGRSQRAGDGVAVADLETLLKQKTATLISRCSEKDLYDLLWLFGRFPELDLAALLGMGREIDGGVAAESVLISLAGAPLEESACGFSLTQGPRKVLEAISKLKRELALGFDRLARAEPPPRIGEMVQALRRGSHPYI